ncbi:MAG: S1C family serine protease [Thermoguttaceae bacterium]
MSTSDSRSFNDSPGVAEAFEPSPDPVAEEAPVLATSVETAEPAAPVEPPPLPPRVVGDVATVQHAATLTLVRLATWTLIAATLVAMVALPYIAERVQYAITRGQQLAKAEVARQMLAEFPDAESRRTYVANSIAPSVVGIETSQLADETPSDERELFFDIPRFRKEGIGSGVIVDPEGYVVTNNHVIDRASEITVKLSDGTPIPDVQVIGRDPLTDLAVLKIEGGPFTAAPWGDSGDLESGDAVLAVGNPFGLDHTVTAGIISATGRRARISPLAHQDFLQTDTAVNPGNSGGPLVNMRGEVIGINTAIYGEQNMGISFAIPSQVAKEVYLGLRQDGRIVRGWLGVAMRDINEKMAAEMDLAGQTGAIVTDVIRRSPADRAGVEPYDVIVAWNDVQVAAPADLSQAVAASEIGSSAVLVVLREGARLELKVRVGQRPVQMN